MTTATAPHAHVSVAPALAARATRFDRTLLRAASAIDAFVVSRLERRAGDGSRRAVAAQAAAEHLRRDAEARGAIGILPR
ncbi:hypothetical protein [Microbacterium sp. CPCC 204701]|uniref:hypothetical protein n=1 Tax=Microbacterium sp. CPCC 204701 TaxID=2493084 RepID=UPI000FDBE219|nr:hypothetical protein [Microbacterium sp. CPCC 204701]